MSLIDSRYRRGTWRLRHPAETLAWIEPHLSTCGITRCADVTQLERIGIPVYCAIRPTAAVLQISNGKGLTHDSAKVSALMEAIEFFHCENPEASLLQRDSEAALATSGRHYVPPEALAGYQTDVYRSPAQLQEWVHSNHLQTSEPILVPASAVFFHRLPSMHLTSTNGLASGNNLAEATLHALFELIERDAAAGLLSQPRIPIKEKCQVIELNSMIEPDLNYMRQRIEDTGSRLVLLRVESCIDIPTFWAILMNEQSWISGSTFNTGWGTHIDPAIAASRAITEAIQSKVTMIHGAREDAQNKPVFRSAQDVFGSKAFKFFMNLAPDTNWSEIAGGKPTLHDIDLEQGLAAILAQLAAAGHTKILRCDLTKPNIGIPVVRLIAPTLKLRYG